MFASYEISSRTKYIFDGQLFHIMGSLILIVGWMLLLLFQGIVDSKHVLPLPIVGMLFLSSIDSISSSLNIITTTLVENQTENEMRLSSGGATVYEVGNELFISAIQETSMPSLQIMLHILILGMLGMMMGSRHYFLCVPKSVDTVASQMRTVLLIALCTLSTIFLNYVLLMEPMFSPNITSELQVLASERFTKNRTRSLISLINWVLVCAFDGSEKLEGSCPSWTTRTQVEQQSELFYTADLTI